MRKWLILDELDLRLVLNEDFIKVSNVFHSWWLVTAVVRGAEAENTSPGEVHDGIVDVVGTFGILGEHVDVLNHEEEGRWPRRRLFV